MFYYDPGYMMIMLLGGVLTFLPQMWVKNTYTKFKDVPAGAGYTGVDLAKKILQDHQVYDVDVEMVGGELSDHYDPTQKKVRLSQDIYRGQSVSSLAIAAHEVGHALQHATGYYPVVMRSALVPAVNIGSKFGPWLLMIALGLGAASGFMPDWAWLLAWLGVLMFGASVLFHMVTLPVEINASMRAVKILEDGRYLTTDAEVSGAKKVLTAAAFTYIAVALYSLIQLFYWIMRVMGSRRTGERAY
ncbi:MAG: zinc metallopeptidase [Vampirovibrio sp.]|nr:zinc metallopeptidase [Vampirovibrio sp.]